MRDSIARRSRAELMSEISLGAVSYGDIDTPAQLPGKTLASTFRRFFCVLASRRRLVLLARNFIESRAARH